MKPSRIKKKIKHQLFDCLFSLDEIISVTLVGSFVDRDDLSGISDINNISLKIDDIPILFEYNLYQNKIFYNFQDWLSIGEHSLEIEVQDNVGNKTYKKGTFIIE